MEPTSVPNTTEPTQPHLSDKDVSRLRVRTSTDGTSQHVELVGTDESIFETRAALLAAEKERAKNLAIESGRVIALRYSGKQAKNDTVAQVFATFDERYTGVQPAEFYRYVDPEIDRHGYF